jgi:hypothetical protein
MREVTDNQIWRRGRAAYAIEAYVATVGDDYDRGDDESLNDAIADLLTDLRHYCAGTPGGAIDVDALWERSADRFAEEVAEGVQDLNTEGLAGDA